MNHRILGFMLGSACSWKLQPGFHNTTWAAGGDLPDLMDPEIKASDHSES